MLSMQYIRPATANDYSRIAEIYVINNRMVYFPIFKNARFSFVELQVSSYEKKLLHGKYDHIYVYDDGIIKGFVIVKGDEIQKLHVDYFFQNQGIGSLLLDHAIHGCNAKFLWTLQKNLRAIQFYKHHNMKITDMVRPVNGPSKHSELAVKIIFEDNNK